MAEQGIRLKIAAIQLHSEVIRLTKAIYTGLQIRVNCLRQDF